MSSGETKDFITKQFEEMNLQSERAKLMGKYPEQLRLISDTLGGLDAEKNVAIVTFGRFQPPHKGHMELIESNYEISEYLRSTGITVDSFVWVATTPDEEGILTTNPPKETVKRYLKDMGLSINRKDTLRRGRRRFRRTAKNMQRFRNKSNPLELNSKLIYLKKMIPLNVRNMSFVTRIGVQQLTNGREFMSDKSKNISHIVRRGNDSGSKDMLWFLKRRKHYDAVFFLVGSDRVEAFKKWNKDFAESLNMKFNVLQSGSDRGIAGQGQGETKQKSYRIKGQSYAGTVSGSALRKAIISLTNTRDSTNIREKWKFVLDSLLINNMTTQDVIDLINDVRKSIKPSATPIREDIINYFESQIENPNDPKILMPRRGGKKTRKIRKRRKRRKTRKRKGGMKRRRSTFGRLPELEPLSKKLKTPNTQEAHQERAQTPLPSPLPSPPAKPETKSDYDVSRKYQIGLMFANLPDGDPDKRYIWEFGGTENYIELWNLKSKAVWVLKQPDNIEKIPTGPGMLDWRTIIIKDRNGKELGMSVLPKKLENNNNDEQYNLLHTKNNELIREGTVVIVELPPPPTGGGINKRKRRKTRKRKKKRKTRKSR